VKSTNEKRQAATLPISNWRLPIGYRGGSWLVVLEANGAKLSYATFNRPLEIAKWQLAISNENGEWCVEPAPG
jgi:hypothetical protein